MRRYAADVAVLARKDLTLELRARDTLPAMLLFVVSTLVVFHFALPKHSSDLAAKGLLWVALVFTALVGLTRAFVAEREQRLIDGLCWLRAIAARSGSPSRCPSSPSSESRSWWRSRPMPCSSRGIGWSTIVAVLLADVGIVAVGTLLAAVAAVSRTRELLLPLLFLPLAIPVVVGGVGASVVDDPGRYLGFLCLYDAVFAIISWASFEYVVTE